MALLYVLIDPDTGEIRYVGWTSKTLRQRLGTHLRDRDENHRTHWCRAVVARGSVPIIRLIQGVSDADWQAAERYWISFFRRQDCPLTNATDGGDGTLGRPTSDKTRKQISTSLKMYVEAAGINPAFTFAGRSHTDESKARIGQAGRGRVVTPETRAKISKGHQGLRPSEETRAKISAAAKIRTPRRGYKHTEETRKKLREAARRRHAC